MPLIGAHVSTAGGLDLSLDRALEITADCTQIFLSPPQQWRTVDYDDEVVNNYLTKLEKTNIGPNFVHGIYLINLASENPENLKKAIDWLIWSQKTCGKLHLAGTNFHLGSHKGNGFASVQKLVEGSLAKILANSPDDVDLILENSAGNAICGKIIELGTLIKNLKDKRLKVCIDTQHAFASGYDLRDKEGVKRLVDEIAQEVGIKNVVMIHTNDSKMELGSGRDRHENIGEGLIGENGFELLLNHPQLKHLPFVLEVPGFSQTGPDQQNIDLLRSLVH